MGIPDTQTLHPKWSLFGLHPDPSMPCCGLPESIEPIPSSQTCKSGHQVPAKSSPPRPSKHMALDVLALSLNIPLTRNSYALLSVMVIGTRSCPILSCTVQFCARLSNLPHPFPLDRFPVTTILYPPSRQTRHQSLEHNLTSRVAVHLPSYVRTAMHCIVLGTWFWTYADL